MYSMYSRSSKGGLAQDILGPVALKVLRIKVVKTKAKAESLGSATSRGAAAAAPKELSQILAQGTEGGMGTKEKLRRYAPHAVRMRGFVGTQDVLAKPGQRRRRASPRLLIVKWVRVEFPFRPPLRR